MDQKTRFLTLFAKLEKFLRIEYERGDYKESTFMGTLFRIRGKKQNAIIANPACFDVLQQAAQLRNIIVHNEDIASPSAAFIDRFAEIVRMITKPEKLGNVMIPLSRIKKARPEDAVDTVMELMETHGFSKIPVFADGRLAGVFTEKAFYYYLSIAKTATISRKMLIGELLQAIDLDGDPAAYFDFISRNADVFQALHRFQRDFREKNKLEMLFVTENGLKGEAVLGIVTLKDLEHVIAV